MSLVVARVTARGRIRLIGDLRVLDPHEVRRGFPFAILKLVVTQRHLCVGFAGSVDAALDALESVAGISAADAVELELAAYTRTVDDVEFLVADASAGRVSVVRGGEVAQGGWLGDSEAFNVFQAAYEEARPHHVTQSVGLPDHLNADDIRVAWGLMHASNRVLEAGLSSVGEAFVTVASNGTTFEYMTSATQVKGRDQTMPSGEWTTVQFDGAAEGGFSNSILTPTTPGVGAIGIHFFQGQLGLLYAPLVSREPEAFHNVSHDDFRAEVLRQFGFDIQGVAIG